MPVNANVRRPSILAGWMGALLVTATLLGGCAGASQTPYNARQACDIVGGRYTADGRCLAGNP